MPKFIQTKKNINSGTSKEIQLYDLAKDPHELINIANEHPTIVQRLEQKIQNTEKQNKRLSN